MVSLVVAAGNCSMNTSFFSLFFCSLPVTVGIRFSCVVYTEAWRSVCTFTTAERKVKVIVLIPVKAVVFYLPVVADQCTFDLV